MGAKHKGPSLGQMVEIYDRAYSHDGIMGTDLDSDYDHSTKSILLSFAAPLAGKRLLDVGSGNGRLWDYVEPAVKGYALDLSTVGLSRAARQHPTVTVSASIAECIPYPDGFFGAVVAADTIEHTFNPSLALAEIHRVLQPGGLLLASFPIPNSLRKWGWNRLIRGRPDIRFLLRLARVVVKRSLLFGRPDFQPIDRDRDLDEWQQALLATGFSVDKTDLWPRPPDLPIVHLVRAQRVER
jgi:SAM-dependent methyltransferase